MFLDPVQPIGSYLVAIDLVEHLVATAWIDFYSQFVVACLGVMRCKPQQAALATDGVFFAGRNENR